MDKTRRLERLVVLTKRLTEHPSRLFSLGEFAEEFGCAKSTLSEDISMLRDTLEAQGMGNLETLAGAAGGVRYLPFRSEVAVQAGLAEFAGLFCRPDRIIPGGFLYMSDVLFSPELMVKAGELFFQRFASLAPDFILTVETKGIPLALMTARAFNIPLAMARQGSKVTEGSAVSINFLTGSARRIQTMSMSRRALPSGAKVLVIDDFMKAGGTARGLVDLAAEVGAKVLGTGVLIATAQPEKKLVEDYTALLVLHKIDETLKQVDVRPAG